MVSMLKRASCRKHADQPSAQSAGLITIQASPMNRALSQGMQPPTHRTREVTPTRQRPFTHDLKAERIEEWSPRGWRGIRTTVGCMKRQTEAAAGGLRFRCALAGDILFSSY